MDEQTGSYEDHSSDTRCTLAVSMCRHTVPANRHVTTWQNLDISILLVVIFHQAYQCSLHEQRRLLWLNHLVVSGLFVTRYFPSIWKVRQEGADFAYTSYA